MAAQGPAAAEAAAAALQQALPYSAHDPRAPDVPQVHPSPKFCQCSVRMTPFPGQWSHLQARQACQGYAAHYGQVLIAWTGFSNSGRLYGAVRFAKPASAKRMMTAYHTKGVPGAPKNLLFIEWQGKVPADLLDGQYACQQPSAVLRGLLHHLARSATCSQVMLHLTMLTHEEELSERQNEGLKCLSGEQA